MTELAKPLSRRTRGAYCVLYRHARPIIVTLAVGDLLEFRESGRRQRGQLPVDVAFRHAVHLAARAAKANKRRAKA